MRRGWRCPGRNLSSVDVLLSSATTATWVGAIATAAAVVVALLGYVISDKVAQRSEARRRPLFTMRFDQFNSHQEVMATPLYSMESLIQAVRGFAQSTAEVPAAISTYNAAFVRLAVTNEVKRDAAVEAQVLVIEVRRLAGGRKEPPIMIGSPPLGWTSHESSEVTISGGLARLVDFGWLKSHEDTAEFVLGLKATPNDRRHVLAPGTYQVRLAVTARNADAAYFNVLLEFDGEWADDEAIWDHLKVSVAR